MNSSSSTSTNNSNGNRLPTAMSSLETENTRAPLNIVTLVRRCVAGALSLIAFGALLQTAPSDWYILSIPLGLLLAAVLTIHFSKLALQLLSRAIWWSNLALGLALSVLGGSSERAAAAAMTLACGAAILVVGKKSLAEASEREDYAPAAFRSSLLLMMVFALADAQTFALFGIVCVADHHASEFVTGVLLLFGAVAYVVAFVGYYRLAIWAAGVSFVTSLLLIVVLVVGMPNRNADVCWFLGTINVVHCLVLTPMLLSVVLGKNLLPSLSPRFRSIAADVVLVGLMAISVVCYASHVWRF